MICAIHINNSCRATVYYFFRIRKL